MIVNYNGVEVPVNFLKNNPLISAEETFSTQLKDWNMK
jgi:hypothetical protein